MKKFFEKHELPFCIGLIIFYLISNSFFVNCFSVADLRTVLGNTAISLLLLILIFLLKGTEYYGLKKPVAANKFFFFLPLAAIASVNLFGGIKTDVSSTEALLHILTMLNVGFIEEIIFRGFLFRMMEKENLRAAITVNALTFGIGHIINLLNGAELIPTLLQICYAAAVGYLFVIIFYKSGSLIPCIIAHSVNNALSVFSKETFITIYIAPLFLIAISLLFAAYINKIKISPTGES